MQKTVTILLLLAVALLGLSSCEGSYIDPSALEMAGEGFGGGGGFGDGGGWSPPGGSGKWSKWVDPSSTATLNYSVASDGVCTITVGGVAQPNNATDNWGRWKADARYGYTAKANTSYTYVFEAWTESGSRTFNLQYYANSKDEVYINIPVTINSTRQPYTRTGQSIPKGGGCDLQFQCADQIGTFYVRIVSIEPVTSSSSGGGGGGELWSRLTAGSATWTTDDNYSSFSLNFTKTEENSAYGYCELLMSPTLGGSGKVYVKLNGAPDPWFGNIPGSKNISFGGGSSDSGTLTFSSNTAMTISGITSSWGSLFNGSYTRD